MSGSQNAGVKSRGFLRLSTIIPAVTVGLALVSCAVVGVIGYTTGRDGLEKAGVSELSLMVQSRHALLSAKLDGIQSDLSNLASGAAATLVMKDLASTRANLTTDMDSIRSYYQAAGSAAADRAELNGKTNKTMYSWRHGELHGSFLSAWKAGGYGDIYGITNDGLVLYSVTKGDDFLQSVTDGSLAATGLGEAFKLAAGQPAGTQVATGFSEYGADAIPSMFLAQPVYVNEFGESKYLGVIAMRVTSPMLDKVLADRKGLGETGQTYLVAQGGMVLTTMPALDYPTALKFQVSGKPIEDALRGGGSTGVVTGKDGLDRMVLAEPINFMGQTYAVVADKTVEETLSAVTAMRDRMIMLTLITLGIVAVVALLFSRTITKPLQVLVQALTSIANGNLSQDISAARRGDEIGEIGRAVLQIRENAAAEQERRAQEEAIAARSQAEQRKEMLSGLAAEFEASVGRVVETVSRSAQSLQSAAREVQEMTQSAGDSASRAADMSNQAMEEVQSIASASDQLSSSIRQISELIARSSSVAQTATIRAQATNTTVRSLAEAANRIGEVVTLISDIADQTNLLALNATIEAARAGEAGRGFAVVASEVKELASQTGKATGEIQQQIDAIRSATDDAVAAIAEIQETIGEITMSVTEVSSAVEEQSAATQGIADNTQRAARGTEEVTSNIRRVNDVTERTGTAADGFVASASELTSQARHLDEEVRSFLSQVRSA